MDEIFMVEYLDHKPSLQHFISLLTCLLVLVTTSCQNLLAPEGSTQITLEIDLTASENLKKPGSVTTITRVVVTVFTGEFGTASYKELVVKELSVTGRSAQGTISVPIGENRTFQASAYDANKFIQYQGISTVNITESTFAVNIGLGPVPPDRTTLSFDDQSKRFNWTKSLASDFAAYRMYRANSPGVTLSSALIGTIGAVDSTFYVDTERLSDGLYYYRVFVVDTEGLISIGSNEVLRIINN
ncbi:hypothetical protein KJ068_13615 [bacterium]|nr:hypothetical protein [bacterium]